MARFILYKKLKKWRTEHEWLRRLPVAYSRAAIGDAVTACGRVMDDCSDHAPYRENDGRIVVGSANPPLRRGGRALHLPGFGEVTVKTDIDESWDMRRFRLVDATHRVTRRTTAWDRVGPRV